MEVLTFPLTMMTTLSGSVSAGLPFANLLPNSEEPLKDEELGGYIVTVCCLMLCIFMVMKMPFKTPPILLACCCSMSCCSSSTSRIVKDVQRRVASAPAEEDGGPEGTAFTSGFTTPSEQEAKDLREAKDAAKAKGQKL